MRAVDELITLMMKVCRPVSRRLSVIERGDPLWNSLTHKFQMSEKFIESEQILELTAKIQELQNEVNCMNDSKDFQDAESVRSGHSHVTSQPAFSHLFEILAEC